MQTLITILKSNVKTLYIDVDGTLLDSTLDKRFNSYYSKSNHPQHKDNVISWYRNININNLKLNYSLILQLIILKYIFNYTLILWTNRGISNIPMTKSNLSIYWNIFDQHQFHSGQKYNTKPTGIIIDNEPKYLELNNHNNILINF